MLVGPEIIIGLLGVGVGFFTWAHQQRQNVINTRFNSIKKKVEEIEEKVSNFPVTYALKSDLTTGILEIKDRLNHINDKLDQLILSKINEK
jgi:tetrahydromethanopterin S-methyltransferase subunit G